MNTISSSAAICARSIIMARATIGTWGDSKDHVTVFTAQSYLTYPQARIVWYEVYDHLSFLLHWQRQWEVAERVEFNWDFGAVRTDKCWLEQTVKNVDDHRVISQSIVTPRLNSYLLISHILPQNLRIKIIIQLSHKYIKCVR